jgi:hypothetical protein
VCNEIHDRVGIFFSGGRPLFGAPEAFMKGKKPENINTGVDVVDSSNVDQFLK